MKKIYSAPLVEINETEAFEMMALSLQNGKPADGSGVLSRDNRWNIWDEDEEDED